MQHIKHQTFSLRLATGLVAAGLSLAAQAITISNVPLQAQVAAKPMVLLVAGKDHKLYYEAYNDASDIDGDGTLDVRFKPSIVYYGLFDSTLCYSYAGADSTLANTNDNTGLFSPAGTAGAAGKCSGNWSGNWLNYVTTSRIDALRKVLYGGYREVDTAAQTILRRSYIPQDAHSWAKEYTSETVDGYKISDYTAVAQPAANKRHFFGNLTLNKGTSCTTITDCSGRAPLLAVVKDSSKRVWEWASTERPVLDGNGGGTRTNYTVRAEVCSAGYTTGCKAYGTTYKPVGLLHDYGENESMLFGLLTGSYDNNLSGGRLRKVVSSFKDEVDQTNGVFTSNATIVKSFNALRIRDFNNNTTDNAYKGGWLTTSAMSTEGQFPDWGNPIAEMMYEGLRYFKGKNAATSAFTSAGTTIDAQLGLTTATWDDPYSSTSAAKAPRCAKANFLTISDINPSYDSDSVPGTVFGSFSGDVSGLNVATEGQTIANVENLNGTNVFIGQTELLSDSAPTAKAITSLGKVRGLAPEEPTKQGSYYAASVAYYAHRVDIRPDLNVAPSTNKTTINTFSVALASPLPKIAVPLANGKVITIVPFAKSVGGSSIDNTKGAFQPTNQIVDFYAESIVNSGTSDHDNAVNGGYYQAKFRINYEDVEQGADHDMDAIVSYTVTADASSNVTVVLTPEYQAGGIQHRMGYVISGSTKDGVYLVVQDESDNRSYFLNVPPGRDPGYCDVATMPADCTRLPYLGGGTGNNSSSIIFTAGTGGSAGYLKDPLWYAAKWGSYNDFDKSGSANDTAEWDADGDGIPDNYFLVQNPSKLHDSLAKAFNNIAVTNSSASNVIANSTSVSDSSQVYQGRFDSGLWAGDLVAYPVSSTGISTTPAWRAATRLPAAASRKIYVRTSTGTTTSFSYSSLPSVDQTALVSSDVVDYLRGVRTKEKLSCTGCTLRDRSASTVLGDITHSAPFLLKDIDSASGGTGVGTLFVGANDGMLHAFKERDGTVPGSAGSEVFAFIPSQVIPRLKKLSEQGYQHDYYVDGDITVTPRIAETNTKNYLFAALGRGGKGLFALDVTSPGNFSASNFLWEYTPAGSTAAATDADLGLMLGRPIFAKMNDGSTAVIAGNGYNSTSGKAVLYIFLLDTYGQITSVKKFDTLVSGTGEDSNGLAAPGLYDTNGDGKVDFIYAGDLKGNVWKFDVSSTSSASWTIALSGAPLFVAKNAANELQPITAPISIAKDTVIGDLNENKRFVFFGTGSYFRQSDPSNANIQSWYGLIDTDVVIAARSALKQRTISATVTTAGKPTRTFSEAVAGDMIGKSGWFADFSTQTRERMVTESDLVAFVVPILLGSTIIPAANDPCGGGSGFLNAINPFSGANPTAGILDIDGNGAFDDVLSGSFISSVDIGVGMPSKPVVVGKLVIQGGTDENKPVSSVTANKPAGLKGRVAWREIIKD